MRTLTIPADGDCPFPVEITITAHPASQGYKINKYTAAPAIRAGVIVDEEYPREDITEAINQLRRMLARKLYANKSSEFYKLMFALEDELYPPLGKYTNGMKVRDIVEKIRELMYYCKP